jgi:hypothetical protein
MLRRVLLIVSVVGLVGSLALWGLSYWGIEYGFSRVDGGIVGVYVEQGAVSVIKVLPPGPGQRLRCGTGRPIPGLRIAGIRGMRTRWRPTWWITGTSSGWRGTASLPIWLPTASFSLTLLALSTFVPFRLRRRRRLGLCLACGYDLRGSQGQCSECGWESG